MKSICGQRTNYNTSKLWHVLWYALHREVQCFLVFFFFLPRESGLILSLFSQQKCSRSNTRLLLGLAFRRLTASNSSQDVSSQSMASVLWGVLASGSQVHVFWSTAPAKFPRQPASTSSYVMSHLGHSIPLKSPEHCILSQHHMECKNSKVNLQNCENY